MNLYEIFKPIIPKLKWLEANLENLFLRTVYNTDPKTLIMNRDDLYNTAYAFIGTDASPSDVAPDELGCAESLSRVVQKALPELRFPLTLSTRLLYSHLIASPSFQAVQEPLKGDIILSVTGTGNGNLSNGHCGIVGKYWIMSNDSRTGTWEATWRLESWRRYYQVRGGMETHFFRLV